MSLRPWLELIRLPAVFTAPADVLAGLALATAWGARLDPLVVGALLLASLSIYCAGMAANDLADLEVDREERPGRPIPSGRVSVRSAWALVLGLQGLGLALGFAVSVTAGLVVAGTIAMTYLYDMGVKDGPLGPWAMGACRYGNALIGLSVLTGPWPLAAWLIPAGTAAFVATLILLSRFEVDGATRAQLRLPVGLMLLASLLPALWPLMGWLPMPWAALGVVVPFVWLLGPLRRALAAPSAKTVQGGVMAGIFAIAMINGVLAAEAGLWWAAVLAVGLLVPGRAVGRWFYAT
jgi:4-hydroxybenzoate polyprenyltransferase